MVKGLTMLVLLLTLALGTAVATANGQEQHGLTAQVPFDFIVGDKELAAGQYQIRTVGIAGDALAIRSADSKSNAIRLVNTTAPQKNKPARLVFHRYGNVYFLSQVWEGGDNVGRRLQKSQQERAMEREQSRLSSNGINGGSGCEEVVILASAR
jgi:hypothetical protein